MSKVNSSTKGNFFSQVLEQNGIKKISIIDDGFDIPPADAFNKNQFEDFLADIRDNDLEGALKVNEPDDFDDNIITELWTHRLDTSRLAEISNKHLFNDILASHDNLYSLCKLIKEELTVDVECLGAKDDFIDTSIQLIFIDHFLGSTKNILEKKSAVSKSIEKAESIYKKYNRSENKPIIILMSSKNIAESEIDDYRNSSGLLGGMFYFVPKKDLIIKDKLFIRLGAIVNSLDTGHKIQHFIDNLSDAVEKIIPIYLEKIKRLSIEDYGYIQKLSLQDDAHLLGDYMLWLYGEHFVQMLFDEVEKERRIFNKLTFEDLPPTHFYPSGHLTDIYASALYDFNIDETSKLGDIYVKDQTLRMIINAQCDLSSTTGLGTRTCSEDFELLLLHGKLVLHTEYSYPRSEAIARTEFFEYTTKGKKQAYRILWDLKCATSINHKELNKLAEDGFSKLCRLKLPFALQLQNKFAANLTRVGVPVAPPIYSPVRVQLFCEGIDGTVDSLIDGNDMAFLFYMAKEDKCILTENFIYEFKRGLERAIGNLDTRIKNVKSIPEMSGEAKTKIEVQIKRKKNKLEVLQKKYSELIKLKQPIKLQNNGEKDREFGSFMYVSRNRDIDKYNFEKYSLLLNIKDLLS